MADGAAAAGARMQPPALIAEIDLSVAPARTDRMMTGTLVQARIRSRNSGIEDADDLMADIEQALAAI